MAGENLGTLGTAFIDIVVGTDSLQAGMGKAEGTLKKFASSAAALFGIGGGMYAAVSIFRNMAAEAIGFQASMSNVATLLVGTTASVSGLSQQLLDLDGNLGSSKELADAMYESLSAGVEAGKAVDFVTQATKLAKAELFAAGDSAKLLATVMNAYGHEVNSVTHLSDVFVDTINVGVVRGGELAHALGSVIPTAAQAGVSIEQVSAAIAVMTRTGIDADTATTSLNRAILSFIAPSEEAKKLAKELGIELSAQRLKQLGLKDAINEVVQATKGNLEAQSALFGDIRGFRAALALTGAQAADFAVILKHMETASGQTHAAFKIQQENISSQFSAAWNNIQRIVDRFVTTQGGPLVGALKGVNAALTGQSEVISGLSGVVIGLGSAYAAVKISALATSWYASAVAAGTVSKQVEIYSAALFRNAVASEAARVASIQAQAAALGFQNVLVKSAPALGIANAGLMTVTTSSWSLIAAAKASLPALNAMAGTLLIPALAATAYQLGIVYDHLQGAAAGTREFAKAQAENAALTVRLASDLKRAYPEALSAIEHAAILGNEALMALGRTLGGELKTQTDAAAEDTKRYNAAQAALKQAIADSNVKLTELQQKFSDALKPADNLEKELVKLQLKFSNTDIVAVYGEEIIKQAKAQRENGYAVSSVLAPLEKLAVKQRDAAAAADEETAAVKRQAEEHKRLTEAFQDALKPADALEKVMKELGAPSADLIKVYGDQIIEATKRQREHGYAISENLKLLEEMALKAIGVKDAEAEAAKAAADNAAAAMDRARNSSVETPAATGTSSGSRNIYDIMGDVFGGGSLNSGLNTLSLGDAPGRHNQQVSIDPASLTAALKAYALDPFGVGGAVRNSAPGGIYSAGQTAGSAFGGTVAAGPAGGSVANFGRLASTAAAIETLSVSADLPSTAAAVSASDIFSQAVDRFDAAVTRIGSGGGAGVGGINVPIHMEFHNTIQAAGVDVLTIRKEIIPEMFDAFETGVDGWRERVTQVIVNTMKGLTSSTAT